MRMAMAPVVQALVVALVQRLVADPCTTLECTRDFCELWTHCRVPFKGLTWGEQENGTLLHTLCPYSRDRAQTVGLTWGSVAVGVEEGGVVLVLGGGEGLCVCVSGASAQQTF